MFLKIFYTILIISILNEVNNADPLPGCVNLSDRKKKSISDGELVIPIETDTTKDMHFISVGINNVPREPAMLQLSSCEVGSTTLGIVNKTTFIEKVKKYNEASGKNLTLNFAKYKNNCIPIADIKRELETIFFGKPEKPTLYVVLSTKKPTEKKIIKSERGIYMLIDDCKKSEGQLKNDTEIITIIKEIAKQVQEAAKIEFPEGKKCQKYTDIVDGINKALKEKYKSHPKIGTLDATVKAGTAEGLSIMYNDEDETFSLNPQADCTGTFRNTLFTATKLEDAVEKITQNEIQRVETHINKL